MLWCNDPKTQINTTTPTPSPSTTTITTTNTSKGEEIGYPTYVTIPGDVTKAIDEFKVKYFMSIDSAGRCERTITKDELYALISGNRSTTLTTKFKESESKLELSVNMSSCPSVSFSTAKTFKIKILRERTSII